MKKINKILSVVICFVMTVCCLPSVTFVNAADVTENIVSVNEVTNVYSDISEAKQWSEVGEESNYTTVILDENDGYVTLYHDSEYVFNPDTGAVIGKSTDNMERTFSNSLIAKDEEYSTSITADALSGKYKIEIKLEGLMLVDPKVTTSPYWDIFLRNTSDKNMVLNRIRKGGTDFMSNSASADNKMKAVGELKLDLTGEPTEFGLTYTIDTDTGEVECYRNDMTDKIETCTISNAGPVKKLFVRTLTRVGIGSFLKFKEVKVTQLSLTKGAELTSILEELPETLVEKDSINNVKRDVELVAVDGVTWTSSNKAVLDPATGKITRSQEEDVPVVVTASFKADGINYKKNYNLTIAQSGVLVDYYVDGEEYQEIEIKKGETASDITAPQKEHYVFDGWYNKANDEKFDFTSPLNEHTELYAKYEPKTYNVYFKKDGETIETLSGKYGFTVDGQIPEIPYKQGYTAVNWMIGDTETVFSESTIINGDMIVNAGYIEGEKEQYTVIFNVDGNKYDEKTVVEGFAVAFPANPEKENYVFEKWQLNGEDYDVNAVVTGNLTLDAVFKPVEMAVNFYDEDKTTKLYDGKGFYMEKYEDFPINPTKEGGWKFAGWVLADGTAFDLDYVIEKPIDVYATYVSTSKVIYDVDFTKFKTNAEAEEAGWMFSSTEYTSAGVFADGGVGIRQTKSQHSLDGTSPNSTNEYTVGAVFAGIIEEDEANRTKLKMINIHGKYQMDLRMGQSISESYPADYTGTKTSSFSSLYFGKNETSSIQGITNGPIWFRVYNKTINPFNAGAAAGNTFASIAIPDPTDYVVHVLADTRDDEVTVWVDDGTEQTGARYQDSGFFNGISLKAMQRFGVGSYVKFKSAKITLLEEDTENTNYKKCMESLSMLPDKLCDNPYSVTGNINLPEFDNVKWTSSVPAVISESGEVNQWYDDMEVIVTATITSGDYKYEKEYTLTVPKKSGVEAITKLEEEFGSKSDLINWYFPVKDSQDVKYSVDESGIKFEKMSASADLTSEVKNGIYNTYFELYSERENGIYANDYKGVYDINISAMANISSAAPATISVGYRSGDVFYNAAKLNFSGDMAYLTYRPTSETEESINISSCTEVNDYKLRIDTVNKKIFVFANDELVTTNGVDFTNSMPEGMEYEINSLKLTIDKNNDAGDYILIDSVKLTELEGMSITDVESAVLAAKMLSDNTVTSTPDNLEGYINSLPATTNNGYKVEWRSNTDQIDIQTGEVFHSNNAVSTIISAYVSDSTKNIPAIARRDFKVTIRGAKNETELAKYDLNSMGEITNQPYDDIRYDIALPEVDGVTWTSSNTSVLSDDGKLNREFTLYDDTNVTLTATKNGVKREYPLTVNKYNQFNVVASGEAVTGNGITVTAGDMENVRLTGDVLVNISLEAGNAGTTVLCDSMGNKILEINQTAEGIVFNYLASDNKVIAFDGTADISVYVIPEKGKLSVTMNGETVVDYADSKETVSDFAKVVSYDEGTTVKFVEIKADSYTTLKANADNINYFKNIEKAYAVNDIDLVTDTIFGAVAEWSSSDNELIDAEGKVKNADTIKYATLTLTLSDADDSKIKHILSKKIAVDVAENRNIAFGANVTVSSLETPTAPLINVNDNDIDTGFMLTDAIHSQYMIFDFEDTEYFNTIYVNHDGSVSDYTVAISEDGSSWKNVKEGTFNENIESRVISLDDIQSARYIRFIVENGKKANAAINEFRIYLIGTAEELAEIDIETITLPKSTSVDIELPSKGPNGTKFVWSSSDEGLIDIQGKVTVSDKSTVVKLTVTNEEGTVSKTFDVTVNGKSNANGPAVVGGGGSSGGGGGAGGSAGVVNNGLIGSVKPGDTFTTDEIPAVDNSTSVKVYSDVKNTDWFYEAVMTLTEKGVVSGDGSGYFGPSDFVTREQFVKMILLATDTELSNSENTFDDVKDGAWYEQYITTAKENGVVYGITDTLFGVGANISRQDMSAIIARMLEKSGYTPDVETEKFADDSEISEYAYDAVYAMKNFGLIQGYEGKFNPKDNLTRAEAAKVITSLIELLEDN